MLNAPRPIFSETKKHSVYITQLVREKIIYLGEISKLERLKRNTTPVKLPNNFGDVIN